MSKFIASIAAAAIALTAAPLAAFAAQPAPVRLDIASVDFSNREQVAALNARIGQVQDQMCKRVGNKAACRDTIMFKINAQLSDAQKAALASASGSETVAAR